METPPHSSLAHAYAPTESHRFPFPTLAMKASLYLNLQVHQNLKVHFFAVRASTTRLRCETYSTFFLFGPLTTLMVFTCFRCDAGLIIIAKFDVLVTVCRQNLQEIIALFFWHVLIISSPSCLE